MNALRRWNTLHEIGTFEDRLTAPFDLTPLRKDNGKQETLTVAEWAPLVDISETESEYLLKADLPEVKKEDLRVSAQKSTLTISGERKFEKEEKHKKYHRIERAYGRFMRSFALPDDVEEGQMKAEFKTGMLTVHLPKSTKAKPRSVEVNRS